MRTTTILGAATLAAVASLSLPLQVSASEPVEPVEPDRTPAIAFASDRDGDNEIYLRAADGTVTQLTKNRHDDHGPVWSPSGRRIAFVSNRDGDPEIFTMNADGSRVRQLTRNSTTAEGGPAIDAEPAWSPNGRRIAFTSTRDGGEAEIYVMTSGGAEQTRLTTTDPWVMDHGPDWSPNGKEIAFSSNRVSYENTEIYRMRANGTRVLRVTRTAEGVDDNAPAWSPNGTQIAFTSNRSGTHDLYVMQPKGQGIRKVSGDPALDDVFPRWTANGDELVFWTFADASGTPSADVWSVRLDGGNRQRLVASTAEDSSPDPRR